MTDKEGSTALEPVMEGLGQPITHMPAVRLLDAPPKGMLPFGVGVAHGRMGLENRGDAEHALAHLRDLYCQRVLLVTPIGQGGWPPEDLRAMAFVQLVREACGATTWGLFGFDLYDYKTTPDWLNPRYWANPHLWDRYRW